MYVFECVRVLLFSVLLKAHMDTSQCSAPLSLILQLFSLIALFLHPEKHSDVPSSVRHIIKTRLTSLISRSVLFPHVTSCCLLLLCVCRHLSVPSHADKVEEKVT